MKSFHLFLILALMASAVSAQEVKFPKVDSSPADVLYYPLNAVKVKDDSKPQIKVIYSRPAKKGRDIFGALEPFGKVWRVGANESTEIRFFNAVTIGGKKIEAGTYSLFAVPNADKWEIIINKQTDRWGAYTYDKAKDVVRVEVPVKALGEVVENLSMTFVPKGKGADLVIGWDKTSVELPISF
jgi:hypothetical protein